MIFGKYPYFKKALRAVHGAKRSLLHAVPYTKFSTRSLVHAVYYTQFITRSLLHAVPYTQFITRSSLLRAYALINHNS